MAVIGVWKAYRADEGFAAGLAKHVSLTLQPRDLHPWHVNAAAVLEQERAKLEDEHRANEARKLAERQKRAR